MNKYGIRIIPLSVFIYLKTTIILMIPHSAHTCTKVLLRKPLWFFKIIFLWHILRHFLKPGSYKGTQWYFLTSPGILQLLCSKHCTSIKTIYTWDTAVTVVSHFQVFFRWTALKTYLILTSVIIWQTYMQNSTLITIVGHFNFSQSFQTTKPFFNPDSLIQTIGFSSSFMWYANMMGLFHPS